MDTKNELCETSGGGYGKVVEKKQGQNIVSQEISLPILSHRNGSRAPTQEKNRFLGEFSPTSPCQIAFDLK
jgi:hypothetical protein